MTEHINMDIMAERFLQDSQNILKKKIPILQACSMMGIETSEFNCIADFYIELLTLLFDDSDKGNIRIKAMQKSVNKSNELYNLIKKYYMLEDD